MVINVVIIGKIIQSSGNFSTASRISNYFANNENYKFYTKDCNEFHSRTEFDNYLISKEIKCIIGIHVYHSGVVLTGAKFKDGDYDEHPTSEELRRPIETGAYEESGYQLTGGQSIGYALVCSGTDVNVYVNDGLALSVMTDTVKRASFLITFNISMMQAVQHIWPRIKTCNLLIIPQAVTTYESHSLTKEAWSHCCKTFLLVAGIRPVKDPLFVVDTFQELSDTSKHSIRLLIVGPILDREYGVKFIKKINSLQSVTYIGGQPLADTHRMISQSYAFLNTSESEGMSTAILEAMSIGVPVLARDISGNRALIIDGETGVLFHDQKTFAGKVTDLLEDKELRATLTNNARRSIDKFHNVEDEFRSYKKILQNI